MLSKVSPAMKNITQKMPFLRNSESTGGLAVLDRNEILQELRNSAAKIVTKSKKRPKATTR